MDPQVHLDPKLNHKVASFVPVIIALLLGLLTVWIGFSLCNKIPDLMKTKTALENKKMETEEKIVGWQTYSEREKNKLKDEKKQSEKQLVLNIDNRIILIAQTQIKIKEKSDAEKTLMEKSEKSKQHEDDVKKQEEVLIEKGGLKIKIIEGPPRQYVPDDIPFFSTLLKKHELPWYLILDTRMPPLGPSLLELAYNVKIYAELKAAWYAAKAVCDAANEFEKSTPVLKAREAYDAVKKDFKDLNDKLRVLQAEYENLIANGNQIQEKLDSLSDGTALTAFKDQLDKVKKDLVAKGFVSTILWLTEVPEFFASFGLLLISLMRLSLIRGSFKSKSLLGA